MGRQQRTSCNASQQLEKRRWSVATSDGRAGGAKRNSGSIGGAFVWSFLLWEIAPACPSLCPLALMTQVISTHVPDNPNQARSTRRPQIAGQEYFFGGRHRSSVVRCSGAHARLRTVCLPGSEAPRMPNSVGNNQGCGKCGVSRGRDTSWRHLWPDPA